MAVTAQCREESDELRDILKNHLVEDQPNWVKGTFGTNKGKPECPDRWIDNPRNSKVLQVRIDSPSRGCLAALTRRRLLCA